MTFFQSELFKSHYKKIDEHCDYFCVFYQIFGILSIFFTIIDIMKEIYEAFMLKKNYFSDLYNYPAVFGSILKLIFLSIDLYLFHNDYSDDLANSN